MPRGKISKFVSGKNLRKQKNSNQPLGKNKKQQSTTYNLAMTQSNLCMQCTKKGTKETTLLVKIFK